MSSPDTSFYFILFRRETGRHVDKPIQGGLRGKEEEHLGCISGAKPNMEVAKRN